MSASELVDRTRQSAVAELDYLWRGSPVLDGPGPDEPPHGRAVLPGLRGFLSPFNTARTVRRDWPEAAERIVGEADEVVGGTFRILGFGKLDLGGNPDWHRDPVHGIRSPRVHFSRLDPLDVATVGDHKAVWEINRHGFLKRLTQAYALTGSSKYSDAAASLLRSWIDENPPGIGINYTSSLEMALRAVNWLFVWPVLAPTDSVGKELREDWWRALKYHLAHIATFLSTYFSPNTHLTGEALALYLGGLLAPDLDPDRRFREKGRSVLAEEFRRQLLADGLHFERSACYHHYTLEFLVTCTQAADLHDLESPPADRELLARATDAGLALRRPDGRLANIGDEDGGSFLELEAGPFLDPDPVLAASALLLGRADVKGAIGNLPPGAVWMLGGEATEKWRRLGESEPSHAICLAEGGYCSVRSGWSDDVDHLILDVGQHGAPPNFGHAHCDGLALNATVVGRPLLVDRGTWSYLESEGRNEFRGTFSHNTLWIEDRPNSRPSSPFAWEQSRDAELTYWRSGPAGTVAEGSARLGGADSEEVHRRRVVSSSDDSPWLVWDRVAGRGERMVVLQYLLPFHRREVSVANSSVTAPSGRLRFSSPGGEITSALALSEMDWSPRYGSRRPGTAVRVRLSGQLPLQCLTWIGATDAVPEVKSRAIVRGERVGDPAGRPDCRLFIRDSDRMELLALQPFGVTSRLDLSRIVTDAAVLWVTGSPVSRGIIADGELVYRDREGEGRSRMPGQDGGDIVEGVSLDGLWTSTADAER